MLKLFRCLVLVGVSAGVAVPAVAGELTVTIGDGRATVIAKDVPLRDILAEWARVGNTRIVNGEKLLGGPISLELIDMPEKEVLDILLRSAAGYLTGPRPAGVPGASLYDRVMILATSRPPATTYTSVPAPFTRTFQAPQPPPEDDDVGEPRDQGPNAPPGMIQNPGVPYPGGYPGGPGTPPQAPVTMPVPGQTPIQNPNMPPGALPPGAVPPGAMPPGAIPPDVQPGASPPGTAPRPGMIPAQPQQNPYGPFGRPPGADDQDDRQ